MAITLIETVEISTPSFLVEFNDIPQDGTHLFAVISVRSSAATQSAYEYVSINHDTSGSNHYWRSYFWGASTSSQGSNTGITSVPVVMNAANSTTTYHYGTGEVWFYDYTDNTDKMFSGYGGSSWESIASNDHILAGGRYATTDAITSLRFYTQTSHAQYSTLSLYSVS